MKDKRGPLEYGFLSAKVVGHSEPTYEDQKKSTDYFFKIGIYTQEEYETRVAELKKKYKKIAKALYDKNRSMMDRLKDI